MYKILARATALAHFIWVVWILFGCYLAVIGYFARHPIIWGIYLLTITANVLLVLGFNYCFLTTTEGVLLKKHDKNHKAAKSFTQYWVKRITGITIPTYSSKIALCTIYVINLLALIYWR